jgi:hypothetical protein
MVGIQTTSQRGNRMNDTYIVTGFVVIDDLLNLMNYNDDSRAKVRASEIMIVAVVAAKYFQNHHERALLLMQRLGYIPKLSISRFNRRLHALLSDLWQVATLLSDLLVEGTVFIIDSMPLPVCKLVRAFRCKKVRGKAFHGYCASKKEHYFGWQLHLVCDATGVPVSFQVLPARWDELVPVQDLLAVLPAGSQVVADKGYISYQDEILAYLNGNVRLIPKYRKNMRGNRPEDAALIRKHRSMIETVNSQLEKMGLQRLHARTSEGVALKVLASLVALAFTNVN